MSYADITNALTAAGYGNPEYQADLRRKKQALQMGEIDLSNARQQQQDITGFRQALQQSQGPLGGVPTEGVPAGGGLGATASPELPDPDKVALDYWSTRSPAMHGEILKKIGEQAQEVEKRTSDPEQALAFWNKKTGRNDQAGPGGEILKIEKPTTLVKTNKKTGKAEEIGTFGQELGGPIKVPAGETLLNPKTYAPVYKAPEKETDTAKEKKIAYASAVVQHPEWNETVDTISDTHKLQAEGEAKKLTGSKDEEVQAAQKRIMALTEQKMRDDLADRKSGKDQKLIDDLSDDVASGRIVPQQVTQLFGRSTAKGGIDRGAFLKAMHDRHPGFNFAESGQNFIASTANQKNIRTIDAASNSLDVLEKVSKEYGPATSSKWLNDVILTGKVQFNSPEAIKFQGAVALAQDNAALVFSAGGVPTESARQLAQQVIAKGYSSNGVQGAVDLLRQELSARREAFAKGTTYERTEKLPPTPSGPKVGTEDSGYIYIGGPPSSPTSWRKK